LPDKAIVKYDVEQIIKADRFRVARDSRPATTLTSCKTKTKSRAMLRRLSSTVIQNRITKMKKTTKLIVLAIGIILLVLGFGNIWDDSRVLVYDLTAIFAGIGFIIISRTK